MSFPRLFVAVDTPEEKAAVELGTSLASLSGLGIKLGLEFFGALGPSGIRAVQAAAPSTPIFLDLKFHDIPNTVAGVVKSVVPLQVALMTLHSSGGPAMMKAAVAAAAEAAEQCGCPRPKLLAVTVLTSLDDNDLAAVGQSTPAESQVVRLAELAQSCGMDGVVCSAREIEPIRKACGKDFILVVPGIRPAGAHRPRRTIHRTRARRCPALRNYGCEFFPCLLRLVDVATRVVTACAQARTTATKSGSSLPGPPSRPVRVVSSSAVRSAKLLRRKRRRARS